MTTMNHADTKPNGPAAAAFLAAGIGAFAMGLNTTLAVAFPPAEGATPFWDFATTYGLGEGVGPLSGKVIVAVLAYVISFVGLGLAWRGREVNLGRVLWISAILVAIGIAGTFPPIFELFHAE